MLNDIVRISSQKFVALQQVGQSQRADTEARVAKKGSSKMVHGRGVCGWELAVWQLAVAVCSELQLAVCESQGASSGLLVACPGRLSCW